jgi:hypothetical protein
VDPRVEDPFNPASKELLRSCSRALRETVGPTRTDCCDQLPPPRHQARSSGHGWPDRRGSTERGRSDPYQSTHCFEVDLDGRGDRLGSSLDRLRPTEDGHRHVPVRVVPDRWDDHTWSELPRFRRPKELHTDWSTVNCDGNVASGESHGGRESRGGTPGVGGLSPTARGTKPRSVHAGEDLIRRYSTRRLPSRSRVRAGPRSPR